MVRSGVPQRPPGGPRHPTFRSASLQKRLFSKIPITRPVGECFVAKKTMRSGICWVAPFASPNRAWAAPPRGGSQEVAPDATGDRTLQDVPRMLQDVPRTLQDAAGSAPALKIVIF